VLLRCVPAPTQTGLVLAYARSALAALAGPAAYVAGVGVLGQPVLRLLGARPGHGAPALVAVAPVRRRTLFANALLAVASLVLTLGSLEAGFRHFAVYSDGLGQTRAAQRWFQRYWGPLNHAGYRDREIDPAALAATRRLYVVGDSFAAGHGIEDREARFADRVRRGLGPAWSVVLLARNGWNTTDELLALRSMALPPDVIVLSWYVNDIEAVSPQAAPPRLDLDGEPAGVRAVVQHSDLANFVYWRVRRTRLSGLQSAYWQSVLNAFDDPATWERYATQLRDVAALARAQGALLLVIAFPDLTDVVGTHTIVARVATVFRDEGAEVVDLAERFTGRPPQDLVVSALDAHPNAAVHAEVGELVLRRLAARGLTTSTAALAGTEAR
jgi:hypothetical protein